MPAIEPRMTPSPVALTPGLLVLHGNRLEDLAATAFEWLARHPLAPLEEETLLVQSNGMAEWLKHEWATAHGVCAAVRLELPARFLWRSYRAVLGRQAVPAVPPLDKLPLTWRLMRLLPDLLHEPVFAPVAGFLGPAGAETDGIRRLQLAQRLADLFDQYQVHRADWLHDWLHGEPGRDTLRSPHGKPQPVPDPQRWQPALWRAVVAALDEAGRAATRPALHDRFVAALTTSTAAPAGLARRLVVFGTTHVPAQTLEAIAAIARHSQVLLAVPNPCRHHWADLIEGRELLRATRRRHAPRGERDLAALSLVELHAHGHPLLAAWGRQSRDFIGQLDAYDDAQAARERFALPRIDLFDEGPGRTWLQQVQANVRDLVPLAEHPHTPITPDDRSIVFHQAHSAQREVEVLHDQLLEVLARPPQAGERGALAPRDIVVMVPDIDTFAPAIRSVFGQHAAGDARFIPWGIADQRARHHDPLLAALDWLLRAPQQRCTATELLGLLEVPAVARRLALADDDLPLAQRWIAAAGVRWGLDGAQRAALGLAACGDMNTWAFGLRRMLLGYAVGDVAGDVTGDAAADAADTAATRLAAIVPCAEVGGLSAALAGSLAELFALLQAWWHDAALPRPPVAWGERLRTLLAALLAPGDTAERATVAALHDALAAWLQACDAASFDEPVPLAVARQAWFDALDEPSLAQRFQAGGVTFCTLLPLRAIPFEVVCLLGMNDGDYPRRGARSDFDLMALPGMTRPGDRSRRDDDRQLMLDALLSARRVLYVSWCGRSQRDNQPQPPSVLVAQMRDYLAAGWSAEAVKARTTQHPLQPFSRVYFEAGAAPGPGGLFTYAAEWRAAFDGAANEGAIDAVEDSAQGTPEAPADAADLGAPASDASDTNAAPLTLDELARFLRNPVKDFFRRQLNVVFDEPEAALEDDEPFDSGGLERWQQIDEVLREARRQAGGEDEGDNDGPPLPDLVVAQVARLRRAGRLPLGGPGEEVRTALQRTLEPILAQWQRERAARPRPRAKRPLRLTHPQHTNLRLEDWLVGLRSAEGGSDVAWLDLQAGQLAGKKGKALRAERLLPAWLRLLAAAACAGGSNGSSGANESTVGAVLIGRDVVVTLPPITARDEARDTLIDLIDAWATAGRARKPLPVALKTGLAWLDGGDDRARMAYNGGGSGFGENREECLARLYPDYDKLRAQPGFEAAAERLYDAFRRWAAEVKFDKLPDAALDGGEDDE